MQGIQKSVLEETNKEASEKSIAQAGTFDHIKHTYVVI